MRVILMFPVGMKDMKVPGKHPLDITKSMDESNIFIEWISMEL